MCRAVANRSDGRICVARATMVSISVGTVTPTADSIGTPSCKICWMICASDASGQGSRPASATQNVTPIA